MADSQCTFTFSATIDGTPLASSNTIYSLDPVNGALTINTDYTDSPELDGAAAVVVIVSKTLTYSNHATKVADNEFDITFKHSCRDTTIIAPAFATSDYTYDFGDP